MAKNILEKLGLVERVEDEKDTVGIVLDENYCPEDPIEVNTENVAQESLVEDIYNSNDLTDTSKSIFKVEEIKATLPTTMTTEAMKVTVAGILSSFGLTAEELVADATQRIAVLKAACEEIVHNSEYAIDERKAQIEEAKKLIETYEKEIEAYEHDITNTNNAIGAEVKRITELNTFLGGKEND